MNIFISLVFVVFFQEVYSLTYGNNTQCPRLSKYDYPAEVVQIGTNYRLQFSQPVLIEKILINTTGCDVHSSFEGVTYSISYIDGSDASYMLRTLNDSLSGNTIYNDHVVEIPLGFVLYTELVILSPSVTLQCSKFIVQGCRTDEICQPGTCQNGGTCIGDGFCACTKGFMGDNCSTPVDQMTFDNYDVQAVIADILFSQDAAFDISGDVSFTIHKKAKRSPNGHRDHHGNAVHIHGHGGSCTYSTQHNKGYHSAGHHTNGHYSSNSPTSAFHGGHEFSHSAHHSHGHNHDHHSHQYLYTTHGQNHHSPGVSLHTHYHHLHMHVHDNHHGHHYHVTAPYPSGQNHIVSTYCPNGGASIIINGNLAAQQTLPHTSGSLSQTSTNIPGKYCFGTCGPVQPSGTVNVTMSNMKVSGGCVPTLTNNNILGMLGQTMSNFLLQQLLPPFIRQSMSTTTSTTTTTTTTTTTITPIHSATTKTSTTKTTSKLSTAVPVTTSSLTTAAATPSSTAIPSATLPTTLTSSTTAIPSTTLGFPILTRAPTSAILPVLTRSPTTAILPVLTRAPTTSILPVLTRAPTTAILPLLTKAPTTTMALPILTRKPTTTVAPGTTCQDSSTCSSLRGVGSLYNVCADPVLSTTTCQKSCNKCP